MPIAEASYSHKGSEYVVTIEAADEAFFVKATSDWNIMSRKGEDVVRAVVRLAAESKLAIQVTRRKDGVLNDSPGGAAAEQKFYANGREEFARHYKNGQLNDSALSLSGLKNLRLPPDDGFGYATDDEEEAEEETGNEDGLTVAAVEEYYENGDLRKLAFYKNGVPHSHAKGEPAILEMNEKKEVVYVAYYENGVMTVEKFKETIDREHTEKAAKERAQKPAPKQAP